MIWYSRLCNFCIPPVSIAGKKLGKNYHPLWALICGAGSLSCVVCEVSTRLGRGQGRANDNDSQYLHCGLIDSLYRRKAFCTGIVHLSAGFHHTSSLLVLGPDTIMYTEKTGLYFSPHTLPTFISAGAQIGDFKLIVSNTESHLYTKTTNTWIFPPVENCTV